MHVGSRVLLLNFFNHDMRNNTIFDNALTFSDNALAKRCFNEITKSGDSKAMLNEAKHELFSKNNNLRARELIDFCMSIDVCKGDTKGAGAGNVPDFIKKLEYSNNSIIDDKLIEFLCKKLRTNQNVVEAYCQAITYEPTNSLNPEGSIVDSCNCLENEPRKVHEHVESYVHKNNKDVKIVK